MSLPQSLHERSFSTIHAASPAGESVSPTAAVCGLVRWMAAYAPSAAPQAADSSNHLRSSAVSSPDPREDRHARIRSIHGDHALRMVEGQRAAHVTAQAAHQLCPQSGHRDRVQRRPGRSILVTETRPIGNDHVERIRRVGAARSAARACSGLSAG